MKRYFSLAAQDAYKMYSNKRIKQYLNNGKDFPFDYALNMFFVSQREKTGTGGGERKDNDKNRISEPAQSPSEIRDNNTEPESTLDSRNTHLDPQPSEEETELITELLQSPSEIRDNNTEPESTDHGSSVKRETGQFSLSSQDNSATPSCSSRQQGGTQKAETQNYGEGSGVPSQNSCPLKATRERKVKVALLEQQKAKQQALTMWREMKLREVSVADKEPETKTKNTNTEEQRQKKIRIVNQAEHRGYKCLKVYDCLVVQNPVDETRGILDIRLPKDFKSVDGNEVFEATNKQFSGVLTAKGATCNEYMWQMYYNMGVLNDSQILNGTENSEISWAECFLFGAAEPLKKVEYDEGKFSSFTMHFEKCVEKIFLPVIALHKEVQEEAYTKSIIS
ncbi:uncharacterized protein LOC135352685 [Latimeria chalumnae]|uniref:uncharacterized protein LOC135352685 n=1 Tax=Latimeria chalumnae TaxID=7897 RepID=UPI00313E42EB